jgi:hypothetical protein
MPRAALIILSSHMVPVNLRPPSRIRNLLKTKHLRQSSTKERKAKAPQVLGLSEDKPIASPSEEDASSVEDPI